MATRNPIMIHSLMDEVMANIYSVTLLVIATQLPGAIMLMKSHALRRLRSRRDSIVMCINITASNARRTYETLPNWAILLLLPLIILMLLMYCVIWAISNAAFVLSTIVIYFITLLFQILFLYYVTFMVPVFGFQIIRGVFSFIRKKWKSFWESLTSWITRAQTHQPVTTVLFLWNSIHENGFLPTLIYLVKELLHHIRERIKKLLREKLQRPMQMLHRVVAFGELLKQRLDNILRLVRFWVLSVKIVGSFVIRFPTIIFEFAKSLWVHLSQWYNNPWQIVLEIEELPGRIHALVRFGPTSKRLIVIQFHTKIFTHGHFIWTRLQEWYHFALQIFLAPVSFLRRVLTFIRYGSLLLSSSVLQYHILVREFANSIWLLLQQWYYNPWQIVLEIEELPARIYALIRSGPVYARSSVLQYYIIILAHGHFMWTRLQEWYHFALQIFLAPVSFLRRVLTFIRYRSSLLSSSVLQYHILIRDFANSIWLLLKQWYYNPWQIVLEIEELPARIYALIRSGPAYVRSGVLQYYITILAHGHSMWTRLQEYHRALQIFLGPEYVRSSILRYHTMIINLRNSIVNRLHEMLASLVLRCGINPVSIRSWIIHHYSFGTRIFSIPISMCTLATSIMGRLLQLVLHSTNDLISRPLPSLLAANLQIDELYQSLDSSSNILDILLRLYVIAQNIYLTVCQLPSALTQRAVSAIYRALNIAFTMIFHQSLPMVITYVTSYWTSIVDNVTLFMRLATEIMMLPYTIINMVISTTKSAINVVVNFPWYYLSLVQTALMIPVDVATEITLATFHYLHAIANFVNLAIDLAVIVVQYYLSLVKTILLIPIIIPMKILNIIFGLLDQVRDNVEHSIDVMSHRALIGSVESIHQHRQARQTRLNSSSSVYQYRQARQTQFYSS